MTGYVKVFIVTVTMEVYILAKFQGRNNGKGKLTIIIIYAPHVGHKTEKYIEFLRNLQKLMTISKMHTCVMIRDFNAKIGRNQSPTTGKYGLHIFNSRIGNLLNLFCKENDLCIANSFITGKRRKSWQKKHNVGQSHLAYRNYAMTKCSVIDLEFIPTSQLQNIKNIKTSWDISGKIRNDKNDHGMLQTRMRIQHELKGIKKDKTKENIKTS